MMICQEKKIKQIVFEVEYLLIFWCRLLANLSHSGIYGLRFMVTAAWPDGWCRRVQGAARDRDGEIDGCVKREVILIPML